MLAPRHRFEYCYAAVERPMDVAGVSAIGDRHGSSTPGTQQPAQSAEGASVVETSQAWQRIQEVVRV